MAQPIWKDYFADLGSSESVEYRIKAGSTSGPVIYRGKAYLRPDANTIKVRINDVCADYMTNRMPDTADRAVTDNLGGSVFYVEKYNGTLWSTATNVEFTYDWSYDYDYDPEVSGMAFPITGRMDERQPLIFSAYDQQTLTAVVRFKDGTSINVYLPIEVTADFNDDYSNDFAISLMRAYTSGTVALSLAPWQGLVESVTIGQNTYEVVSSCRKYALYYLNAYGGWDFLLVEGNYKETDNLTRHNMQQQYDNSNPMNRGKRNYLNEIVKNYSLHTGWLLDHESDRMHHLLNSPQVFLLDIPSGRMMPVVLTNTTTEYKRFRTNGNRMVDYEITAELAHDRIRR